MAGHNKWSGIKHKKALTDAKRASVFTKMAKDVALAAREGGGDPEINFRLRMAIEKARSVNMPKDNIERAIQRGTGELKGEAQIEEVLYEAYGPGQVAMLIKTATDNKNRTLAEVKNILKKNNGKFVDGGGVSWQFEQKGVILVVGEETSAEEIEMKIIESGADSYENEEEGIYVYTKPQDLQKVKENLERQGLETKEAELTFLAKEKIKISADDEEKYQALCEVLDENEDVAEIWDNLG
ncbi:MAG TPA: YebC/PmpR family DNA-binding transcriptional regulator [Candidatus Moranbacteria bacterium]|nr:YebC/PmpR family DNA-binding transcriptional regulator [Candidatus Moranbacteria bacterium]